MAVEFSCDLPRDASASRVARRAVEAELAGRLTRERLLDVDLLVTELVNNALIHGTGAIRLRLQFDGSTVRGEVIDDGGGFERRVRQRGVDDVGGRGLNIVEGLASEWGIHEGTTHVWFEMPSTHVWFEMSPDDAEASEPKLGDERRPPELDDAS
jgi:anti-sigma regulatory factor (Ser/Thr protein kinase)